jgi:hypothetical protein
LLRVRAEGAIDRQGQGKERKQSGAEPAVRQVGRSRESAREVMEKAAYRDSWGSSVVEDMLQEPMAAHTAVSIIVHDRHCSPAK